ncbi:unnamed protein product, partial [marine sediment metagenome]
MDVVPKDVPKGGACMNNYKIGKHILIEIISNIS